MTHEELLNKVIGIEWDMFQQVQGIGGRASCQDDNETFIIMRAAQFESWEEDVLESYLTDLEAAWEEGRNLVMEKYAYMMEETDPDYYAQIRIYLPPEEKPVLLLCDIICDYYTGWEEEVEKKYPKIRRRGRPSMDIPSIGVASTRNYLKSELKTYSMKTLLLFLLSIDKYPGKNRYRICLEKTVQAYGYKNLDEAEASL